MKLLTTVFAVLVILSPAVLAAPDAGGAAPAVNVCPPVAQAAGFTNPIFYQTFSDLKQFDLTNSKRAGFSWYLGTFPWRGAPLKPTSSSELSVSEGVLTISSNSNSGLGGYQLATQTYLGASAPRTVGSTFAPGGYYEWTFAFDPTLTRGGGWPALWLQDRDGTLAIADNRASEAPDFAEVDIFEAAMSGSTIIPTTNVIEWVNLSAAHQSSALTPTFGPVTWSSFNTVGMLWKTRAENNGVGFISRYINGIPIPDGDMRYGGAGDFAVLDSGNYIMFMDTGPNWPLQVKSVLVCQ